MMKNLFDQSILRSVKVLGSSPLISQCNLLSHTGPSQGLDEKIHMPQPPEGRARPEPVPEEDETGHS